MTQNRSSEEEQKWIAADIIQKEAALRASFERARRGKLQQIEADSASKPGAVVSMPSLTEPAVDSSFEDNDTATVLPRDETYELREEERVGPKLEDAAEALISESAPKQAAEEAIMAGAEAALSPELKPERLAAEEAEKAERDKVDEMAAVDYYEELKKATMTKVHFPAPSRGIFSIRASTRSAKKMSLCVPHYYYY